MGCEPGSGRLLSVSRLCNKSWEESFKYMVSVKEGIDMMYDMNNSHLKTEVGKVNTKLLFICTK